MALSIVVEARGLVIVGVIAIAITTRTTVVIKKSSAQTKFRFNLQYHDICM